MEGTFHRDDCVHAVKLFSFFLHIFFVSGVGGACHSWVKVGWWSTGAAAQPFWRVWKPVLVVLKGASTATTKAAATQRRKTLRKKANVTSNQLALFLNGLFGKLGVAVVRGKLLK
jgi:hypothetical protein